MTVIRASQRARLKWTLLQATAGGLLWIVYVNVMHELGFFQRVEPVTWRLFLAGAGIFGATAAFEFYVYRSALGAPLRRLPVLVSLLVHNAILLAIAGAILAALRLPAYLEQVEQLGVAAGRPGIGRDALLVVVVTFLLTTWSEIRAMIGPRTLLNFVLGRYRRPRVEQRIFAFVDVKNSTSIAAHIGDERFHAYLSEFFFAIDEAIVDRGGEINSYVGDAVIVTWPMTRPEHNGDAVKTVFAIKDVTRRLSPRFEQEFGTGVDIRAALHGGHVVAGQCGDSKRQITYLGDAVNTTARLEQLAKAAKADIVISRALLDNVILPEGIDATSLGIAELKGLTRPIEVVALTQRSMP